MRIAIYGKREQELPRDYVLWHKDGEDLIFAVDFGEFNKDAPDYIIIDGKRYRRGPIEPLTYEMIGCYCSARRYHPA